MSTNLPNQVPFLRTQRLFPQEAQPLSVEMDRAYVDIASSVNRRTMGITPTINSVQNGNILYIGGNQLNGFRKAFVFTATTAITHNVQIVNKTQFLDCYGTYTDGTNSYGLPFSTNVAVAGTITFYLSATQIVFLVGAGAPALTAGRIVLNWFNG